MFLREWSIFVPFIHFKEDLAYFKSLKSLTGEYIFGILLNKLVKLYFSFIDDDKFEFEEMIIWSIKERKQ